MKAASDHCAPQVQPHPSAPCSMKALPPPSLGVTLGHTCHKHVQLHVHPSCVQTHHHLGDVTMGDVTMNETEFLKFQQTHDELTYQNAVEMQPH